ncbi:hypothetical protein Pfo_016968 [Paulownia fortunei]|nr:hypothetical protein Pfo_016968 [Paulownia fortunei]
MEVFMKGENVLPEYAPQGFSHNSPKTPFRNSGDLDFNDVFGGPPRRFSMQEAGARYSFGETVESEEDGVSSPWGALKEKPVFGEESVARRRHQGDDFFDDIFRGDESYSSPRRTDRDRDNLFGSSPGSRIMSPARPLPPKTEPFCTSLPAQFSLPAKLTQVVEFPTFATGNRSQYKMDGSTNGLSSQHSSSGSLSRFSNEATRGQDEIRNEAHPVYCQSPLSHEASFSCEDAPYTVSPDQKDNARNLKKETKSVDSNDNQFHFSIYKWAGRGVPMILPLVGRNNLKSKDISRFDRCASSNGRMESKPSTMTGEGMPPNIKPETLKTECEKKNPRSKEETKELQYSIEEALYGIPDSKSRNNAKDTVVSGRATQRMKAERVISPDESGIREKAEKEVPMKIEESLNTEVKPLRAFLTDEIKQLGNITEKKKNKTITPKKAHSDASKNAKANEGTTIDSNRGNADKSKLQGAEVKSVATPGKSGVKGKIREFVQTFNQEADSRRNADVLTRSESSRWKAAGINQKEKEVDENLNKDEAQQLPHTKTPVYRSDSFSTNQKTAFSSESLLWDSKISVENSDDPFEDNFLVQELSDDLEKVTESGGGSEDMKDLDAKIRQWSVGKKGNIRSLLSTLQYVLWPGSGWKPIPLVDLIEANSVKRAYQKALLRLHPDKLLQKGAASHHKYIAEKVFDILQEAWDHFNTLAPL